MRFWNLGDERLIRLLQAEISLEEASFEVGPDGGVAVYKGARLLGVWVEFLRGRHSFVPAAKLQPTLLHCSPEQVAIATHGLLTSAPAPLARIATVS